MTDDPKAHDSHDILLDMGKSHEEQPGEAPVKEKTDEKDDNETEHAPREDE